MNERIRELASKVWYHGNLEEQNENIQMFAELVVKECASIVENLSPGYDDYRDQIENAFRRDCIDEMKQHFGVEE
jgi:hypothetical protein